MDLNASKAYGATIVGSIAGASSERETAHAMIDLAQAGKNCYDISELILHPTMKLISFEERTLNTAADQVRLNK
jgi:hypothetical protein